MKQLKQLARFKAGDMVLIYLTDDQGAVGMELVPAEMEGEICSERRYRLDPMVQLMARGDDFPDGFINGLSMRCAPASYNLHFKGQQKQDTEAGWRVETVLEDERGLRAVHRVDYCTGDEGVKVFTRLENAGTSPVTLMMLTSFSLQGITPFAPDEATGRLNVYRLRSKWSNEGRLEKRSVEELQLEPTWSKYAPRSENLANAVPCRFGDTSLWLGWRINRAGCAGRPSWAAPAPGKWKSTAGTTPCPCRADWRMKILDIGAKP